MPPPISKPPTISAQVSSERSPIWPSVVSTAMAMPIMPSRLPRRELSGLDSPRSARMNSTPEVR